MRIRKRRERNSRNHSIDFNQILLNDKNQQAHIGLHIRVEVCYPIYD